MQSIFWPTLGIGQRYDVKGCLKGRFQDPDESTNTEEIVFKDQNFLKIPLRLGKDKAWYVAQSYIFFIPFLGV